MGLALLGAALVPSPWTARPAAAAELLEIQLEGLEIPVRLDQLEAWSGREPSLADPRGSGAPSLPSAAPSASPAPVSSPSAGTDSSGGSAGGPPRPASGPQGAITAAGSSTAMPGLSGPDGAMDRLPTGNPAWESQQPGSDLEVWLNLLEPESRHGLARLLRAPLLREQSFGSQLLDSWAGGQMLAEVGDLLTTPEGQSTAPQLRSTLRRLLHERREVTALALLRTLPIPQLRLRLDSLLNLAEQWRLQIEQQSKALAALQTLALVERNSRALLPAEAQRSPRRVQLTVAHRSERLPVDLWPGQGPEARRHPWLLVLPGLGGDADQLGWFAGALAQRGWSVAVPQHPGSDGRALREALDGRRPPPGAGTLATRLRDVEAILAARSDGRLALPGEGVVLVGHSLGGLTALLAAGVEPQPGLARRCSQAIQRLPIGNPSRLLQCELVNTGLPPALSRPDGLRALVLFNGFGSLLWPGGATASLPVPVLMVGGSLDLVTPPLQEQLELFLPAGDPRSRLVLVEGGSHFSPVRLVERQKAVLRLGREWVGVDPATVQTLLLGLGSDFLHSLDLPVLLPAQVRLQPGVRAYVLDPAAARRWRGRLQS
jgi:predicted dienelactone hydrolase